jgi:transaldolase
MTTVVADTGDIEAVRRLKPQDCTTNPTLLLKAAQSEAGSELLERALDWGRRQSGAKDGTIAAVTDRVAVAVGAELAGIVPGRVSTEVDADLSFDTAATVEAARRIIGDYRDLRVERERILIKIAGTWEGIRAAEILQAEGIDCNVTLVFSSDPGDGLRASACSSSRPSSDASWTGT